MMRERSCNSGGYAEGVNTILILICSNEEAECVTMDICLALNANKSGEMRGARKDPLLVGRIENDCHATENLGNNLD